jgi:hypothetical protein
MAGPESNASHEFAEASQICPSKDSEGIKPKYPNGPIEIHVGAIRIPGEITRFDPLLKVYVVLTTDEKTGQVQESFVQECVLSPIETSLPEGSLDRDDQSAHKPILTEQGPTTSGRKPMTAEERSQMQRLLERMRKR